MSVTKEYWNEFFDEFIIELESGETIDVVLFKGFEIVSAEITESDYNGKKKAVIQVDTGVTIRTDEINPFFGKRVIFSDCNGCYEI